MLGHIDRKGLHERHQSALHVGQLNEALSCSAADRLYRARFRIRQWYRRARSALEICFPRAARQRCLAHRMRNLAAKVPEAAHHARSMAARSVAENALANQLEQHQGRCGSPAAQPRLQLGSDEIHPD
jgi:hypothetical protein